jgi:hypothetical protein
VGGNFIYAGGKRSNYVGQWRSVVTAVEEYDIPQPRCSLMQNYPNPFNPGTEIIYVIEERTRVTLSVYSVSGKLIKTLVDEIQEPCPGGHRILWNGTDMRGRKVASGVYFCRMRAGRHVESKKLVVLK